MNTSSNSIVVELLDNIDPVEYDINTTATIKLVQSSQVLNSFCLLLATADFKTK